MFKVVVTPRSFAKADDTPLKVLEQAGCEIIRVTPQKSLEAEDLIPIIKDADAVIAGLETYGADVLAAAPRLKIISRYGVGYNNVDLEAASAKGIAVTNTPGTNDNAVADMTLALMLACARRLPAIITNLKDGTGDRPMGVELWQKTLGVIGLGRIGKGVVRRARGFDMKVLCCELYPDEQFGKEYGVQYCELDKLLAESDFVSINLPLTPSTKGLISSRELSLMKKSAILINTARGGIVDEKALYDALTSGQIAMAGLDVTEVEPATDSPLIKLPNCIITSHIGGYTNDAVNSMGLMAAQNVVDVLTGKDCANIVNK